MHYILIVILLLPVTLCITDTCDHTMEANITCPENSFCSQNKYCVCKRDYVGGCSQKAKHFEDNQIYRIPCNQDNITLIYFRVESSNFVAIGLQITQEDNRKIDLKDIQILAWIDDGTHSILNRSNTFRISQFKSEKELLAGTTFIQYNQQMNRQPMNFVFGFTIKGDSEKVIVLQTFITDVSLWSLLLKMAVILISCGIIGGIISGFILYCKRKKRLACQKLEKEKVIKHFKKFMPPHKFTKRKVEDKDVCSICLNQFQFGQALRKTVCSHTFHQDCLDQWCFTCLNCPVCRTDFSGLSLQRSFNINRSTNSLEEQFI